MGSNYFRIDIRHRIMDLLEKRNSHRRAAVNLAAGEASVNGVWRRFRATGSARRRPVRLGRIKAKAPPEQEEQFVKRVRERFRHIEEKRTQGLPSPEHAVAVLAAIFA